jgi:Ca2+-binding EF-hand superfamily protein
LCQENPEIKAEKLFSEIDTNDDGFLTQDEFLRGCRNDPEIMKLLDKLYNYLTEGMED